MKFLKKLPRKAITAVVFALLMLLVMSPKTYMNYALEGLKLFAVAVLPAQFPFFFFTKILEGLGFSEDLGKLIGTPIAKVYRTSNASGYILLMSMLSGYPVGAKLTADALQCGSADMSDAKVIMGFASTSGPIFILGTVGSVFFNNYKFGLIILVSHYIGAFLNGFIYRGKKFTAKTEWEYKNEVGSLQNLLSDGVNTGVMTSLAVGGFIVIFNIICGAVYETGVINCVTATAESIGLPRALAEGLLIGLLEMTRGCSVIATSGLSMYLSLPLVTSLISFGGLSVTFQSLSFLAKAKIKPGYYLLTKFTQAIISGGVCVIICLFL